MMSIQEVRIATGDHDFIAWNKRLCKYYEEFRIFLSNSIDVDYLVEQIREKSIRWDHLKNTYSSATSQSRIDLLVMFFTVF